MANFVYNIAKGKVAEKVADGATVKMILVSATDGVATHADMAAVRAAVTVQTSTNYVEKTLSATTAAPSGGTVTVNASDVVYTALGGASNVANVAAIIYEEVGVDSADIPLVHLDAVFTPDGNDVTISFPSGFFTAS